jgi:hypothetical protein
VEKKAWKKGNYSSHLLFIRNSEAHQKVACADDGSSIGNGLDRFGHVGLKVIGMSRLVFDSLRPTSFNLAGSQN